MIVERTHYYALPGRAADVLATRRRASQVRLELGLAHGEIAVKADPGSEGPDVTWECAFADADAHARDLLARDQSPAFAEVRAGMTGLLTRFERHVLRSTAGSWAPGVSADPRGRPVVPERVTIPAGGRDLVGFLFRPAGEGAHPAVVVNHGSTIVQGTADLCRPGMAALLLDWGYAVLMPHRHGYGESPGPAWREEVTAPHGTAEYDQALAARLAREAEDVVAAGDWLAARPGIDRNRLGVLGSSFGGTVSLLAAARTGRFRCAIDFAGAAMNWERTPRLREAMLDAAGRLTGPILLVQAANDYSVAPTRELGGLLARRGHPHQALVYPPFGLTAEEGHLFAWTGALVWGPAGRAFLDAHLQGPGSPGETRWETG